MSGTSGIADHYSTGGLLERIRAALSTAGHDLTALTPDDLTAGEHFHTGGAATTAAFIAQMDLGPGMNVLDIGCGIGGVSRSIAHVTGAYVTGVDMTPDFIETASALSDLVGLGHLTEFHVGDATDLPIRDRLFDAAVMVHVGMNVEDKAALFTEAYRVLHPGACLAIFDVMFGPSPDDLTYPVPWASDPANSWIATPAAYRDAALAAGFELFRVQNLRETVVVRMDNDTYPDSPRPFSPRTIMGPAHALKVDNYNAALRAGILAPVEMFFTRPAK